LLWGDGLEMLEQLLAALVAEFVGDRLAGGLGGGAGDGFADQADGVLQPLVEFGQLSILRELLVKGGGLVVRQLAEQQGRQGGFQVVLRRSRHFRVHMRGRRAGQC